MKQLLKRLQKFLLGRAQLSVDAGSRKLTLTDCQGNELSFVSDQAEALGTKFTTKVSVRHDRVQQPELAQFTVEIITATPRADGGTDCVGLMHDCPENVIYLIRRMFHEVDPVEDKKKKAAPGGRELRTAERRDRQFQVMSPDLRTYKALALDISSTGIRLQVEASQPEGDILRLTLDFDMHRMKPIQVEGEIMWCRPADDEGRLWHLGVRFLDLTAPTQQVINRYLSYLDRVEKDWDEGRFPVR